MKRNILWTVIIILFVILIIYLSLKSNWLGLVIAGIFWYLLLKIEKIYDYYILYGKTSIKFWKLVKDSPEESFKYFSENKEIWSIVTTEFGKKLLDANQKLEKDNKNKLIGPFKLFVPSLNKMVLIYGKDGFYQKDQDKLISLFNIHKEKYHEKQ